MAGWYVTTPGVWKYRKKLVVDERKVTGTTALTNYPLLVSVTDSELLKYAQTDADDIMFTAADGITKLDHEIESYSSSTGTLVVWVEIPSLSAVTDTSIYMYYGNANATSQQNASGVWGSAYKGVWHLGESSGARSDSTSNNNDLADNNTVNSNTGKIGTAADFAAASSEYLSITDGAQTGLNFDDSFSFEFWFRMNTSSEGSDLGFLSKFDPAGISYSNGMYAGWVAPISTHGLFLDVYDESANNANSSTETNFSETEHEEATWYNVVGVYDNPTDQFRWYLNGTLLTTTANFTRDMTSASAWPFYLGRVASTYYDGRLDEVRVTTAIPTANWIQTQYNNQADPGTFVSVLGSEDESDGPLAQWKFDEGMNDSCPPTFSGDTCDATGNNNHGAITGAEWQPALQCVTGPCLYFTGTNDYVTVTDANRLDIADTSDFSLSLWVKLSDLSGDRAIVFKKSTQAADTAGYALFYNATGGVLDFRVSDGTDQFVVSSVPFTAGNEWVQITAVYDDDSATNTTIYVNGENKKASTTGTIGNINSLANSTDLTIGTQGNGSADLHGFIDEVVLYPYARSEAQAKSAALSGRDGGAVLGINNSTGLSNGLIGYWTMDDQDIDSHTCMGGASGDSCDSSGENAHGSDTGSMTDSDYVAGKYGSSLNFDGVNDAMQVDGLVNSIDSTKGTISFWMYRTFADSDPDWPTAFSLGNSGSFYHDLGLFYSSDTDSFMAHYQYSDDEHAYVTIAPSAIPQNQWTHVTITWNKTTDRFTAYINGSIYGSDTGIPTTITLDRANIGAVAIDDSSSFEGNLDEVRVYNRELTADDVRSLYTWSPGPAAYWNFDDALGGYFLDKSGYPSDELFMDTPGRVIPGKYGNAIYNPDKTDILNETIDYPNTRVPSAGSFTYSAWFKLEERADYDDDGVIVGRQNCCGSSTIALVINADENLELKLIDDSSSGNDAYTITGSTVVPKNTWVHVAGVFDRSSEANSTVYINGIRESVSRTGTFSAIGSFYDDPFYSVLSGYYGMKGAVDEFRIYNYARSQSQIVEDMNGGHPIGGSPVASQAVFYRMNEISGQSLENIGNAGTTYPGTLGASTSVASDDPTWKTATDCKLGGCLSFDGTNDFVTSGNQTVFNPGTGGFTVSAWIHPASFSAGGTAPTNVIISKYDDASSQRGYALSVDSSGQLLFGSSSTCAGGGQVTISTGYTLATGAWTHVAGVWDGAFMKVFANGKQVGSTTAQSAICASTAPFAIGTRYASGSVLTSPYTFTGKIDEVKYYSAPLTAEQIALDMNANAAIAAGVLGSSEAALVTDGSGNPPALLFPFDENTGTISSADKSGNAKTANFANADHNTWIPGKTGSAVRLNGTNQYLSVDVPGMPTSDFTLESWVKTTDTNGVILQTSDNSGGAELRLTVGVNGNAGELALDINDSFVVESGTAINTGQWTHVAAARSGSAVSLYINGREVATATNGTALNFNGCSLLIGVNNTSGCTGSLNNYLAGDIDHMQVYPYARAGAQIAYDFNRGAPIAHWKLNECQGLAVHDSSGNGYTGTLQPGGSGNTSAGSCSSGVSTDIWNNGAVGKLNASLDFDGVDDYVDLQQIPVDYPLSISVWVKPNTINNDQGSNSRILNPISSVDSNNFYGMAIGNGSTECTTGTNRLLLWDNNCWVALSGDNAISTGVWQHLVITVDSTLNATGYINGKPQLTASVHGSTLNVASLALGSPYIGFGSFFDGQMDDVRIYGHVLSQYQIQQIMNDGAGIRFSPESGNP